MSPWIFRAQPHRRPCPPLRQTITVFNTRSCVLEFTTNTSSNNTNSDPRTVECELECKYVTELHKHNIDKIYVYHIAHIHNVKYKHDKNPLSLMCGRQRPWVVLSLRCTFRTNAQCNLVGDCDKDAKY